MLKTFYTSDAQGVGDGEVVRLYGWLSGRRDHGNLVFLDVQDSRGTLQCVVAGEAGTQSLLSTARTCHLEASVAVEGRVSKRAGVPELRVSSFRIVGDAPVDFSPRPREPVDLSDNSRADHALRNRHLYLRNPRVMAALTARHRVSMFTRCWFDGEGYTEINAPILTALPLYEDQTAVPVTVHGESIFLTQCVGYYLGAAVPAFEKVYSLGPSFRNAESKSRRHLMEYWHIKSELAWCDREGMITEVERLLPAITAFVRDFLPDVARTLGADPDLSGATVPYPRMSYLDALEELAAMGHPIPFGDSIGSREEALLGARHRTPFWILGIPRSVEPFPYVIDPEDPRVTMVADLIAPGGYGEIAGVAEKIWIPDMLRERMTEKGRWHDDRYAWVAELATFGSVPHAGLGIGLERLLRWLFGQRHVRDFAAFPRAFGRRVRP